MTILVDATEQDFASLMSGVAPRGLDLADSAIAPTEVLEMLRGVAQTVRAGFAPSAWMMVEDGEVVGLCSIMKPPTGQFIDIGYGVAPTRQGRGIATRAVSAVLAFASTDPRVEGVTAETSVDNYASQLVLERNGFIQTERRDDPEDGQLICWRADASE
jgi:RimJ/RimL family protein N-acetyltransferase